MKFLKYTILALTATAALLTLTHCEELPQEQPVADQTDKYKRPVREGNCWRQFTATGSSLVCH